MNSDGTANGCAEGEACKYKMSKENGHADLNGVSESEQLLVGGTRDVDNGASSLPSTISLFQLMRLSIIGSLQTPVSMLGIPFRV